MVDGEENGDWMGFLLGFKSEIDGIYWDWLDFTSDNYGN